MVDYVEVFPFVACTYSFYSATALTNSLARVFSMDPVRPIKGIFN